MITRFFIGILLGSGAILPGISSGVICVILGIYDKLINSITGLFKDFKKNFLYLFPLALGGIVGVFLVGNILKMLFIKYPLQTNFCFIGLILGCIPCIIKKVNSEHHFKLRYLFFTLISFIIGYVLVIIENHLTINYSDNLISTPYLILSGFLMSLGVVIPGVSNTIILMCLGVYPIYLHAITILDINILIPMGFGLIIGSIVFLFVIKVFFKYFYMQTYYSIIGFTLGSILILYMPLSFNFAGILSVLLLILSFILASKLENVT